MNNIQFANYDLLQNSEEFKIIMYRLSSNVYETIMSNQPYLMVIALIVMLMFTVLVYYLDSKQVQKSQVTTDLKSKTSLELDTEPNAKIEQTTTDTNNDINDIREEICQLKKQLEMLYTGSKVSVSNFI